MAEEQQGTHEATTGTGQTAFDLEKVDPNTLSPELRGIYNSMLTDYRGKTTSVADERKQMQADLDAYQKLQSEYQNQQRQLKSYYDANQQWQQWGEQLKPYVQQIQSGQLPVQGQQQGGAEEVDEVTQLRNDLNLTQQQLRDTFAYVQGREQQFNQLLGLNEQAWDLRLKNRNNPDFDLSQVIKTAQEKQLADLNTAAALTYGETERETYAQTKAQEAVETAKKEWELAQQNRAMTASPMGFATKRTVSRPTEPPKSWASAKTQALQRLAQEVGLDNL